MSREAVAVALFNALRNATNVATASRTLRHWNNVAPADMPALFLAQTRQRAEAAGNQPTIWRYDYDVYLYAHSENPEEPPATRLNALLDAVETVVNAGTNPMTGRQQLGLPEYVENCRIDGTIETDEGVLGEIAVAIVPIVILSRR